ncbi:tetratricopeptide repeat protein [Limnoraphis robusta]|uniref:Tetratricopeptide repeat protein n=1 Tax=Limnoraphis robusta CCNP1315 TaxID=3110306 RepID=A0ABU5U7G7_9CYAN|nr:tetratricopeptide repeat protein [Limnoraphis robusta]MEA5500878.1 tetratricopeptide repeat protein [Limnoraphis robusta BA-68 BA1]MEA5523114.1 tetratricopeptide repeat protein [Limnoraphis robusta CCNP1315]MEA5548102.1 tetratricopeptide repeat protein [Limnoraphis robusta CCNP1324]
MSPETYQNNKSITQTQSTLKSETYQQLQEKIQAYELQLNNLIANPEKASESDVLTVLIDRDYVSKVLLEQTTTSPQDLLKIIQLDQSLKSLSKLIVETGKLKDWQASFHPPKEAWWWFLEVQKPEETDGSIDVIFDILTLVSLTGTTSFLITFSNLFVTGGLSVLESFGLMGQGGLLIAAIGAFKGKGKEIIQNFLQKKGIPRKFHSQVTFGVSALLFLTSLSIYNLLPKLGKLYLQEGEEAYQKGLLIKAETQYQQALKIAPENPEINVALGEVYESSGNIEEAKEQYERAIRKGSVKALNDRGRIAIYENNLVGAEALLQIGLQQVKNLSKSNPDLEYELNKNLGWAFLQQEKYKEAEQKLKAAIQLDQQIPEQEIGGGMAYCLLGKTLEAQNNLQAAQEQFQLCQKYARPETVDEYKWLIENGPSNLAEQVDTTSIMKEE